MVNCRRMHFVGGVRESPDISSFYEINLHFLWGFFYGFASGRFALVDFLISCIIVAVREINSVGGTGDAVQTGSH